MRYKTYINGYRIFENNEYLGELINELKKQGCKIDKNYCYGFEIKELQPIIEVFENYVLAKYEENKNIADFTKQFEFYKNYYGLTNGVLGMFLYSPLFKSVNLLHCIHNDYILDFDEVKNRIIYKIKKGHHICIEGRLEKD